MAKVPSKGQNIVGKKGNDNLIGTNFNDTINGIQGNDTINGGLGNDVIDGGDGIDTAVFSTTLSSETTFTWVNGRLQVSGPDGVDSLGGIEKLTFGTKTYDINTVIPPVAVNDAATADEETPVAINVLGNDTDVDGGAKEIISFTQASNGTIIKNTDGTFLYRPNADFSGVDTFTYTLDGGSKATVSVTVNSVDDAPVAVADMASTDESFHVEIDVLANDTDSDGGPKTAESFTQGSNGRVGREKSGPNLVYYPNEGFVGTDTFTYKLNGGSETTVTVTVNDFDFFPSAVADAAKVNEGESVNIDVLANDTDTDGGQMFIDSFTQGDNGTVSKNADGTLKYTPNVGFTGADFFNYELYGGSRGIVSVTVENVNEAPIVKDIAVTTGEDTPFSQTFDATDPDGDKLSYTVTSTVKGATIAVDQSKGTFTFTPGDTFDSLAGGASEDVTFRYRASDGTSQSLEGTVTVTLTGVDDAPVIANDEVTVDEDSSVRIDVLANDIDVDGGPKEIAFFSQANNGTVIKNADGTLQYTPNPNFSGSDFITYQLTTGSTAVAYITVNDMAEPNSPPTGEVMVSSSISSRSISTPRPLTADDITDPTTQFFNSANGHIYEFVNTDVRWDEALTLSANRYLPGPDFFGGGGLYGHLVTITSAAENDFVVAYKKDIITVGWDKNEVWIAASDRDSEGTWKWMAGPEAGTLVSSGYSDWGYSNPGDAGLVWPDSRWAGGDYAALTTSFDPAGEWFNIDQEWFKGGSRTFENSSAYSGAYRGNGYVIEYEGEMMERSRTTTTKLTVDASAIQDADGFANPDSPFAIQWQTFTDGKWTDVDGANKGIYDIITQQKLVEGEWIDVTPNNGATGAVRPLVSYIDGQGNHESVIGQTYSYGGDLII